MSETACRCFLSGSGSQTVLGQLRPSLSPTCFTESCQLCPIWPSLWCLQKWMSCAKAACAATAWLTTRWIKPWSSMRISRRWLAAETLRSKRWCGDVLAVNSIPFLPCWLTPKSHLAGDGRHAASPGMFRESGASEEGHPAASLLQLSGL